MVLHPPRKSHFVDVRRAGLGENGTQSKSKNGEIVIAAEVRGLDTGSQRVVRPLTARPAAGTGKTRRSDRIRRSIRGQRSNLVRRLDHPPDIQAGTVEGRFTSIGERVGRDGQSAAAECLNKLSNVIGFLG
jgi:hypothetical protein